MQEPTFNQYAAPAAEVADVGHATGFGELRYFSAKGRIGRLRYLAWTCGAWVIYAVVSGVLAGLGGPLALLTTVAMVAYVVFYVLASIQRAHDFDSSGWTVIATIIPLVALVWVFKAGSGGNNDYGPPPPPNTTGVKIMACIMPALFIIGMLAAIAIPQYKHYTDKARAAAQHQQP